MEIKKFISNQKSVIIHIVKENETIEELAALYNVRKNKILNDSNLEEIFFGAALLIRLDGENVHIVKPLETPKTLAEKYGITVEHLCQINNCKTFFIGQKILVK